MKRFTWQLPILSSLLVAALSYLKSWHCRSNFFASPDSYTHLCYSDIPALFGARGLDQGINPYSDPTNSMEYPVGTGYIASLLARLSNDFIRFFDLNVIAIALLFAITALLLSWNAKRDWPLFIFAPAVISSLYINWDLWGIVAMVLAFHFLGPNFTGKERFDLAGLFFGLSIAIKFFPVFLLPALALYFFLRYRRDGKDRAFIPFFAFALATWIVLNLPTAISHFEGWSRFYTFNQERGIDLGSIWYSIQLTFDYSFTHLNLVIALLALLLLSFTYKPLLQLVSMKSDPFETMVLFSFLSLALLFSFNKVYSPQYVLWLTPLAIFLLATTRENYGRVRATFWIWQTGEAIYHLAIWQYLAEYSGGQGLSEPLYSLSIVIRIASLAVFALSVARVRLSLPSTGPVHTG